MNAESSLSRLTEICLQLPEATREDSGQHAGFLVRKKTFAWFLNDHHGDGIVAVTCKMTLGENEDLAKEHPDRFYIPSYLGPRGWVALRLDVGEIDWQEVADIVTGSYRLIAPKKLVRLLPGVGSSP